MRVSRQIVRWLEAVAWMGLIFSFSGDSFASSRTLAVLRYCNELFHLSLTGETLSLLNVAIRKTAHFGDYFVLGLLVYRAMAGGISRFTLRFACWTMLVGLLYALSDEYHQSFTRFRTPSLYDSGLDFAGVVAAQGFILLRSVLSPTSEPPIDSSEDPPATGGPYAAG
jgi:VanZ family protein